MINMVNGKRLSLTPSIRMDHKPQLTAWQPSLQSFTLGI